MDEATNPDVEASRKLLEVEKWSPEGDDVAFGNTTFIRRLLPTGETTVDDCNIFEALGQVSSGEAGIIFRNFLRGSVRHLANKVMAEEVTALCGPKHHPVETCQAAEGYGLFSQVRDGRSLSASIEISEGTLRVKEIILAAAGQNPQTMVVDVAGQAIKSELEVKDDSLLVKLSEPLTLESSQSLKINVN